jgi:cellulose synthase operon protein C
VLSHRGRAWLAEGRREQGLQALETAAAAAGGGPQSEADLALLSEHVAQGDGTAALRVLDRLAQRHAGRPQPLQWRAELLARQGEPVAARQAFEAALARDSAWLPALEGLTRLDLAAGQPDSARQRWEAVLKKQPRSSAAMLALARLAKLAPPKPGGNAPDAQTWLDRAVAVDPTHADTWLAAIAQHHTFGDTAGALARAQAAALALPDHAPVLAALGQAQLLSGEGQQAARSFARLVELSPRELEPRLWLAEAHLRLSQWPAARKAVQGAAELAPSAPAVLRARIVTELESGQAEAARAIARQQQKAAPKAALGWQLEADIDSRLQRWDAAAQGYRQALAWERSGALAVQLHQTLVKAQRGDEASRWADEWLRHNPRDSAMLLQLARSAGTHSPQAVAAWRRALAVQPDDPLRLNNLAHHLLNTAGKTEGNRDGESRAEALALARRAVQAAPFNAELLDTLAAALAANGQPADAATALRRALDIAPRHDAARLHLARVLIASGDKDQAGIELQKLQDRGADFKRQAEVTALLGTLR